eukprot:8462586-Karenia_brevis.AAC.1
MRDVLSKQPLHPTMVMHPNQDQKDHLIVSHTMAIPPKLFRWSMAAIMELSEIYHPTSFPTMVIHLRPYA